jgi:excisionase family DNA binding protein
MQISHPDPQRRTGLFVRLPDDQMQLLDRAAAAVPAPKKDLISGLVARHVDPDSPEGLEELRSMAATGRTPRRAIVEGGEPRFQAGFGVFTPAAPPDVLDAEGAAELLAVNVEAILALASEGKIPGRSIGGQWRFARQALLDWLSETDQP